MCRMKRRMKRSQRARAIGIALAAILGSIGSAPAEVYPSRPITMIVPYPAGGLFDALARILAEPMRAALAQSVVIENVGGAGGSIADVVHDQGHLFDPPTAVSVIKQVLGGLAYAHGVSFGAFSSQGSAGGRRGVVHRHITPHNILLPAAGSGGEVKLADFGLAKSFDAAGFSGQSMSGTGVTNVVAFMPRAQLINYRFTKPEVDVWACAASLYWMLTGLPPRDFPRGKDPITIVLQDNPVPIQKRNSTIPLGLAAVIDMALKDDPIGISTAQELAAALEVAL